MQAAAGPGVLDVGEVRERATVMGLVAVLIEKRQANAAAGPAEAKSAASSGTMPVSTCSTSCDSGQTADSRTWPAISTSSTRATNAALDRGQGVVIEDVDAFIDELNT